MACNNNTELRALYLVWPKLVPWAGVSPAPRGEVGTLLSQERDVMEENVTS